MKQPATNFQPGFESFPSRRQGAQAAICQWDSLRGAAAPQQDCLRLRPHSARTCTAPAHPSSLFPCHPHGWGFVTAPAAQPVSPRASAAHNLHPPLPTSPDSFCFPSLCRSFLWLSPVRGAEGVCPLLTVVMTQVLAGACQVSVFLACIRDLDVHGQELLLCVAPCVDI